MWTQHPRSGIGKCPLWTICDLKKLDRIAQGDIYRVEFSAPLTFKQEHAKARQEFDAHVKNDVTADGDYEYCMSQAALYTVNGTAQQYSMAGVLPIVKSEKGWRLNKQLYQINMKIEPR